MDSSQAIAGGADGSFSALAAAASADAAEDNSSGRIDILPPVEPSPPPCNDELITVLAESFDTVTPPTLPAGWTATNAIDPDGIFWQTSNTGVPSPPADSPPNAAWVNDPPVVSDKYLDVGAFFIFEAYWAQLTFRHNFNLQSGFDGGVLEISSFYINNGAFTDITDPAVGGSFQTGGYNAIIATGTGSPIAGRHAWSGNSGGFITTTVTFPRLLWTVSCAGGWPATTVALVKAGALITSRSPSAISLGSLPDAPSAAATAHTAAASVHTVSAPDAVIRVSGML